MSRVKRLKDEINRIESDLNILYVLRDFHNDEAKIADLEDLGWRLREDILPVLHDHDLYRHIKTDEGLLFWKPQIRAKIKELEKKRDELEDRKKKESLLYNPWILRIGSSLIVAIISFFLGYLAKSLGLL